jgi:uncharacterized repeat protein (TIGR01451 family)
LWAGLYWGAVAAASTARRDVSFKTPGGSYQTLTADWLASTGSPSNYQAAKVVTSLVTQSGNYTVANVQARTGQTFYGGWALVVVYQHNAAQFRNLTVYDGYDVVNTGNQPSIALSGFLTPQVGPVGARIGVVAYEGDAGTGGTGDNILFNGTQLTDSLNPSNNFFNSSITRLGNRISAPDKNPDYVNQLGFDIDVVNANGVLLPNATNATVQLTTSNETYYLGVITTAIDIHVPNLSASLTKTVADLNGGSLNPGDILEYTISFKNTGQDIATKVFVIDPIPSGTTFVPGSLKIASGANTGAKTDAADADQAEYDSALNQVVFRVGTNASGAVAGSFAPGDSTAITFQVKVNAGTNGQTVNNTATITYTGATLPTVYTANASAAITVASSASLPLLTNQKTVQVVSDPVNGATNPKNIPGGENVYTLTIQNTGPGPVDTNTLVIVDPIPANSELFTGNISAGAPYIFANGALPSGLTCAFVALANLTDCVDFSKDAGLTWTYVPNGAYDPAVTHVRFSLSGAMNGDPTPGSPYPGFSIQFRTRIK